MGRRGRLHLLGIALLFCGLIAPFCSVATRAADDLETQRNAALARVNQWRVAIGVPPIARHPALDQAAQAHATYYKLNNGSGGVGIHNEKAGLPGFTGEDFMDRAQAAGYPSRNVNENMGLSGSLLTSLDWFIGTVNHRLTLLDPRYVHIGFGAINDDVKVEVIDFGAPEWSSTASTTWEQWPPDGASGIGLSFSGESPDPFHGNAPAYPVGAPITLKYLGPGSVSFASATVTAGGQQVPSFAVVGDGWLSRNTEMIATNAPMQPGTSYTVTVTGTANGQAFTRTWSFRTKAKGDADNAVPNRASASGAALATTTTVGTASPTATASPPAIASPAATAPATATSVSASGASSSGLTKSLSAANRTLPSFPAAPNVPMSAYKLPNGVNAATGVIGTAWAGADAPVAAGKVTRSWLYGPDVVTMRMEPYAESPGGQRTVYYFDKARMELTTTTSGVSNGLLVTEMVSGAVQVGNSAFQQYKPAAIPVAGDAQDNKECPTYATLWNVASFGTLISDRRAQNRVGQDVTATLDPSGRVGNDASRAGSAAIAQYEPTLGHNVPDVFWNWMQTLPSSWQSLLGMPVTEPYWIQTRVGGTVKSVLMQAFERRVLTYTPDNPAAWQVEMGNVGLHFLLWHDSLT
jgi:uncharacterized protein YkwD